MGGHILFIPQWKLTLSHSSFGKVMESVMEDLTRESASVEDQAGLLMQYIASIRQLYKDIRTNLSTS